MLGMTVSCARCHDHKFDPIPTMDYYSLHGVFTSINEPKEKPLIGKPPSDTDLAEFEKKMAELEDKDREIYYNLVAEKGAEFRKKAGRLYPGQSLRRQVRKRRSAQARVKVIEENKLERGVLNGVAAQWQESLRPLKWFCRIRRRRLEGPHQGIHVDDIASGNRGELNPARPRSLQEHAARFRAFD